MQKRWLALLGALGGVCVALGAYAASPQWDQSIAIVDSANPRVQATVTSTGALKVDGSAAGGGTVTLGAGSAVAGKVGIDQTTPGTTNGVAIAPTAGVAAGITAVVSGSAEATHVLKSGAGNLYAVYATNLTGTSGFLAVVNATSAPGDGAITPLDCVPLPANGYASINYRPGPAKVYSTGITAVVTSAATCFTKTTGVITAFISGDAQ